MPEGPESLSYSPDGQGQWVNQDPPMSQAVHASQNKLLGKISRGFPRGVINDVKKKIFPGKQLSTGQGQLAENVNNVTPIRQGQGPNPEQQLATQQPQANPHHRSNNSVQYNQAPTHNGPDGTQIPVHEAPCVGGSGGDAAFPVYRDEQADDDQPHRSQLDPGPPARFWEPHTTPGIPIAHRQPRTPAEFPGSSPGHGDGHCAELSAVWHPDPPAELPTGAPNTSPLHYTTSLNGASPRPEEMGDSMSLAGARTAFADAAKSQATPPTPPTSRLPPMVNGQEIRTPSQQREDWTRCQDAGYQGSDACGGPIGGVQPHIPPENPPRVIPLRPSITRCAPRTNGYVPNENQRPSNPFSENRTSGQGVSTLDDATDSDVEYSHENASSPPAYGAQSAAPNGVAASVPETGHGSIARLPARITQAFGRGDVDKDPSSELQDRAKAFLRVYERRKQVDPGQDWLGTLTNWARTELDQRAEASRRATEESKGLKARLQQVSTVLAKTQTQVEALRNNESELVCYKREWKGLNDTVHNQATELLSLHDKVHALQGQSAKAKDLSKQLKEEKAASSKFKGERDYYSQERDRVKVELKKAESDLWHEQDRRKKDLSRLQKQEEGKLETVRREELGKREALEQYHASYVVGLEQNHRHAVQTLRDALQNERQIHQTQLQTERDEFSAVVDKLKNKIATIERDTRAKTASEIADLQSEKEGLRKQIAEHSRTMNYVALEDSHFKKQFTAVCQMINNLVPKVRRPGPYEMTRDIDATGFLGRHREPMYWGKFVRYHTWSIIIQGFFQYGTGLGALGHHGAGYYELYQFYRLFSRPDPNNPGGDVKLPNDVETNTGRAWFFDGILRDVRANPPGNSAEKYAKLFWTNVYNVQAQLLARLQHLCGNNLDPNAQSQIPDLVRDAGLLSLEMASQRSHIVLRQCQHTQPVDCKSFSDNGGTSTAAPNLAVDLMAQPCLARIGDGQGQLHAETILARGDIVAMNSSP